MNTPFARGMAQATELTKAGKLEEATALIQSLLHPDPTATAPVPIDDPQTLEGTFTRLEDTAPPAVRPARTATKPRKTLKKTLREIASAGMPRNRKCAPLTLELPQGAEFQALKHAGLWGSLGYRLYIPANRHEHDIPLIVMLHGCTQSVRRGAQLPGDPT